MAYNDFDFGRGAATPQNNQTVLQANGGDIELPNAAIIRDADLLRDGMDLTLQTSDQSITIENYFSGETSPNLTAPDGTVLTPSLVNSFVKSGQEFASNLHLTDESPVGSVDELTGEATITRTDGSTETITIGTNIYQGDIVETNDGGAVNITFSDDSSFAVSDNARLAIDEYVFDPSTESGQTDFSVLKGVFVYTSGLIGRDDPDDVTIDTPVGSIGIRGTIIAGDVDTGEITVVEGAIVLHDFNGGEVTLAGQFETAKFGHDGQSIEHMGELSASDVASKFVSVSNVAPSLFSSIEDAAAEQDNAKEGNDTPAPERGVEGVEDAAETQDARGQDERADIDLPQTQADIRTAIKAEAKAEAKAQEEIKAEKIEAKAEKFAELAAEIAEKSQEIAENQLTQRAALIENNSIFSRENVFDDDLTTNTLENAIQDIQDTDLLKGYGFTARAAGEAAKILTIDVDQLFANTLEGDTTYQLTAETEALLDRLSTADDSLLDAAGWDFDTATGELTLYINEGAEITDDLASLQIEALAETGGEYTGIQFTLDLYNTDNEGIVDGAIGNTAFNTGGATLNLTNANSDTRTLLLEDGDASDTVTTIEQTNKTIFTGEGDKTVTLDELSANNTIFAGNNSNDTVILDNTNNDIYTLGGDDIVEISLQNKTANPGTGTLTDTETNHRIDGGAGFDKLKLFNDDLAPDQNIDFTDANFETFSNFELIELGSSLGKGDISITLGVEDVISLTDNRNILKIDGNGDNRINVEGFTNSGTIPEGGYATWTGTGANGEAVELLISTDITSVI